MRSLHLSIVALALPSLLLVGSLNAADWATAPSYYTHDQSNGQRVSQFAQIGRGLFGRNGTSSEWTKELREAK